VIVGRACIYIKDDQVTCAEGPGRKLAVVDPFEQRGNKTILVTQDLDNQAETPASYNSSKLNNKSMKAETTLLTPAQ